MMKVIINKKEVYIKVGFLNNMPLMRRILLITYPNY